MDCDRFQLDLPERIYGELDPSARAEGDAHIGACAECAELVRELGALREAQRNPSPPALLTARIKLAARDALLERREAPTPVLGWGGSLHLAGSALLAGCVGLVAFALGVAYERQQEPPPAGDPRLEVPRQPGDLVQEPQPDWLVEINHAQGERSDAAVPRAPEAWQRVLHDAGAARLARAQHAESREFFLRAAAVAPEGPLAAAAKVGAAEALLRMGDAPGALRELEQIRQRVLAGATPGSAPLLQRISELAEEAAPTPEGPTPPR